eukprot:m.195094 g.195094  ORF g.195094 m.195094 type:complete len:86 (-) comp18309_c0_seq3:123-380(-)
MLESLQGTQAGSEQLLQVAFQLEPFEPSAYGLYVRHGRSAGTARLAGATVAQDACVLPPEPATDDRGSVRAELVLPMACTCDVRL